MCVSSRLRRFSGLLSLTAFALAVYVAFFQERTCAPAAGAAAAAAPRAAAAAPRGDGGGGAPAAAAARASPSSPQPAPTAVPALNECSLPLDVMAPTDRPSPSAYPSLRALPSALPGEAELAAARAAAAARHTAQCYQVISNQLANASARLVYCEDYARSVAAGSRPHKDGPFSLTCPTVWFTPAEACALLQAIGKLVVFVGDSIGRQLQQGLFTVLTGS